MDDDMQTHPSQLPLLFEKFDEGYDIVYGYYPEKHHSSFRNLGSWLNYISVRILIGKPKELKTIGDLEKLLKKKGFQELLGEYVVKPQGKPTLAEDSDPRPAMNSTSSAVDDFKDLQ